MEEYKIYLLRCKTTGRCYVGVTSMALNARWENGSGYRKQPVIYNDILKYGWNDFTHEQIDSAFSYLDSRGKERLYIKEYNSMFPSGYNVVNGETGLPRKLMKSSIVCMDDDGKIIREYNNFAEIRKDLTVNQCSQLRVLLCDSQESHCPKYFISGYWGLKIHYKEILKNLQYARKKRNKGPHNGVCIMVEKVDDDGNIVSVYHSQREAVRQTHGAKKTSMQTAITKGKKYLGFYWRYVK